MPALSAIDWFVAVLSLATIAWVNWYFFLAEGEVALASVGSATLASSVAAAAGVMGSDPATPTVTIAVQGGYSPATVRVKAGVPVRLVFDRRETSSCSEEVVFADFGIRRFLPAMKQTVLEVTPPAPGSYPFSCGMGMLRGTLVAE